MCERCGTDQGWLENMLEGVRWCTRGLAKVGEGHKECHTGQEECEGCEMCVEVHE